MTDGRETSWLPFNRPSPEGAEFRYMREAVEEGHLSMEGPYTERAANILRAAIGAEDVLLTTSCTDALEMSAMLLDLEPGDTVIVPSFTFVSTALAYARQGARIVFCDIERETLGIDPQGVADLLDGSVRAVIAVHYAGVGCDIGGLESLLADVPDVHLVEDNAHGLFGTYQGRPLGSFGRHATLSFHETKNFICGEGGALVLNDRADVERAHVLLDKGTNRRQFLQGQVDKYSWADIGSSFGLSDLLAAYLTAQLEMREEILAKRRAVFEGYWDRLAIHAAPACFDVPSVPPDRMQAYHMFYVLLPDRRRRDAALKALHADGIGATFHYVPLHDSPGGRRFAARLPSCPVTEEISGRLLRLPFFNSLDESSIDRVCASFLRAVGVSP